MPRLPTPPAEALRNQAKTLLARFREVTSRPRRGARVPPDPPEPLKLPTPSCSSPAYGFRAAQLRAHLEVVERYSRSPHTAPRSEDAAEEFLRLACLTYSSDDPARWEAARAGLTPGLARGSLHTAAAAGDLEAARGHVAAAGTLGGPHRWEPLLYLAYSRATGPQALDVARLLLDYGADANAGFLWDGLPSPFTALTGAFGRGEGDPPPHADALALARILLEAGADPTDTQATYNLHWTEDDAWLELLLEFGYGRGDGGPWHARLAPAHPTPRETAEDCLMWAALEGFPRRVRLLLDAGVDPDGRGTRHPILKGRTALEVALLEGHREVAPPCRRAERASRSRALAARRGRLHGARTTASPTRRRPA